MANSVRVVQFGVDVLVRNDVDMSEDIRKIIDDVLAEKGFYVCGVDYESFEGKYPGLEEFLADASANSAKYFGSVPPSDKNRGEKPQAGTHEEAVMQYLKRWGYPHPEEDGMLEEFLDGGARQWMYDEAVLNDYCWPDVDRWFCLVNALGAEISFDAAMAIEGALYEEDLDAHEFEHAEELLDTPRGICRDMLRASMGMADGKGLPEDVRLVKGEKDLEILRVIFGELLDRDLGEIIEDAKGRCEGCVRGAEKEMDF